MFIMMVKFRNIIPYMKKYIVLTSIVLGLILAGCQTAPAGSDSTAGEASSHAENIASDGSSESTEEESYTIVETYGKRLCLVSKLVDGTEVYAVTRNGELLYGFDCGVEEIRVPADGFFRVMSSTGEALLSADGEEIFALGTIKRVINAGTWISVELPDGTGSIYRMTNGELWEVYTGEKSYYCVCSYDGIAQFQSLDTLLIDAENNIRVVEGTPAELWEVNGDQLQQFVTEFYNTLLSCTWENREEILKFLPPEAEEALAATTGVIADTPESLGAYEYLRWLMTTEQPLSDGCGLIDVETVCVEPGGTTIGLLEYTIDGEIYDPVIHITVRSDGTVYIPYFEGSLQ
jgi:hypothetical protein